MEMLFILVSKYQQKLKYLEREFGNISDFISCLNLALSSCFLTLCCKMSPLISCCVPHYVKIDIITVVFTLIFNTIIFISLISAQPMDLFVDCCQLSVCWRRGACQVVMSPWRWMYRRFRTAGYNGKATRSVTVLHQAAAGSISGVAPASDKRESWRGREQEREGERWVSNRKEKLGRESELRHREVACVGETLKRI